MQTLVTFEDVEKLYFDKTRMPSDKIKKLLPLMASENLAKLAGDLMGDGHL